MGAVDAEVRLTFDGEKWLPAVTADCRGISLTDAEKFPYALEQTTGRVEYHPAENGRPDQLRLDLTGVGGGRPVKVEVDANASRAREPEGVTTGDWCGSRRSQRNPSDAHSAGYRGARVRSRSTAASRTRSASSKISGTDVPLHEQLLAAFRQRPRSWCARCKRKGRSTFAFRCEWKDLAQPHADVTQDIRLKDCRIQFDPFPYPLQHVQGLVTAIETGTGSSRISKAAAAMIRRS